MHVQLSRKSARLRASRTLALALVTASAGLFAAVAPAANAQAAAPAAAPAGCPWVDSSAPIPQRVSELMSKLTLAQEVSLMTGASGSSYAGLIPAIGSLCIPARSTSRTARPVPATGSIPT